MFVNETIDISNTEGNPRWLDPTKLGNYSVLKEKSVKPLVTEMQIGYRCYIAIPSSFIVGSIHYRGFNSEGILSENNLETANITYDGKEYVPWNKPSEEGKGRYACVEMSGDEESFLPIPTNVDNYNYPLDLEKTTVVIFLCPL